MLRALRGFGWSWLAVPRPQPEPRRARRLGIRADELIRQAALSSPERGLLLHRVRNEALMTVDAYRTLFDASVVFGVRKQIQAEEGVPTMEEEAARLRDETTALEARTLALRNRLAVQERRNRERRELDERTRRQEVDFLSHQHKHLDAFLRAVPGGGR